MTPQEVLSAVKQGNPQATFLRTTSLALSLLVFASLNACSHKQTAIPAIQGEIAVLLEPKSPAAWRLRHKGNLSCSGGDSTEVQGRSLGSQVRLKDSAGKLIATGTVQEGSIQKISPSGACVFKLTVPNPPQADFYTLEIDPYGSISFPKQELVDKQGIVGVTVSPSRQTISNDLVQVRQETEAKRKEYDSVSKLSADLEDVQTQVAVAKEKSDRNYQEISLCLSEQELANFNNVDDKVLSNACRVRLAKAEALNELIGEDSTGLKYRTELKQPKPSKQHSTKKRA